MFRVVPASYSYKWITKALSLAYKKYFTLMASLVFFATISALVLQIPYAGHIASAFFIPILIFGHIYMTKDILETQTTSFKRNFVFFTDKDLRAKTWHVIVVCISIGIFRTVCAEIYKMFPGDTPLPTYVYFLVFIEIGLILFLQSLVVFCVNVVIFKGINLWRSIIESLKMFFKNWKAFTLNGVIFFIFAALISGATYALTESIGDDRVPAFAYLLGLISIGPVFITLPYLIFSTTFENRDI